MRRTSRYLAMAVVLFGAIAVVMGVVFLFQGVTKNDLLVTSLQKEKVNLGIEQSLATRGGIVDTAAEAQVASDTLREHRQRLAPTYAELLGGKRFDATNPAQVTYAQALNLEMYLDLVVLGFGITQMAMAVGATLIVIGIALGSIGVTQLRLVREIA